MAEIHAPWIPGDALPPSFIDLPHQVYRQDPYWIPENASALKMAFSAGNPWFAGREAFLGVVAGKARLVGFHTPGFRIEGESAAFFGFWEGTQDLSAHRELFSALEEWARSKGVQRLYGPINFSTFGANRLRLDRFDERSFPGEPHNPAYYPGLMDALGYQSRYSYVSCFSTTADLAASVSPVYEKLKPQIAEQFRIEPLTGRLWMENLDEIYQMTDAIFGANFAYTPLPEPVFKAACGESFAKKICSRISVLARTHEGRLAGMFIGYPDYSPLMCQSHPQRIGESEIDYETHFELLPRPRVGLCKTTGVHPDFRSSGLFTALAAEISLRGQGVYDHMVACLVRADNFSLNFAGKHFNPGRHTYGLFSKAL